MTLCHLWKIGSNYYDLTKWMNIHPGGRDLLELTQGYDCTALIKTSHFLKMEDMESFLSKMGYLKIAVNNGTSIPTSDFEEEMKNTLRKKPRRPHFYFRILQAIFFLGWIISTYLWLTGSWLGLILKPIISSILGGQLLHDSVHGVEWLKYKQWTWLPASIICAPYFPVHVYYEIIHNLSHHQDVNNVEYKNEENITGDLDLIQQYPIIRTTTDLPQKKVHTLFPLNWIFVSCMGGLLSAALQPIGLLVDSIFNTRLLVGIPQCQCNIEYCPNGVYRYVRHRLGRLLTCMALVYINLCLPWVTFFDGFSFLKKCTFTLFPCMLSTFLFHNITSVSHIQPGLGLNNYPDIYRYSIDTAYDYDVSSYLMTIISAGTHLQSLHHIGLHIHSYSLIHHYPVFQTICKKYNVYVHIFKTYFDAFKSYYIHIKMLNSNNLK